MTILRVSDQQQNLTNEFIKIVKSSIVSGRSLETQKEKIYLKGQEMGFCNDEIEVLLEDIR